MASALRFIVLCGLWIAANVLCAQAGCRSSGCPSGWRRYGNRCYGLYSSPRDWADAERFCTYQRANLVSIRSSGEGYWLRRLIRSTVWVGGYDKVKNGVWLWSDGTRFTFSLWDKSPREPNNLGGEGCMEFRRTGDANDLKCSNRKAFICAKRV